MDKTYLPLAKSHVNPRSESASIIAEWIRHGTWPETLLGDSDISRGFIMELVYGVIKQVRMLEWIVFRLAKKEPDFTTRVFLFTGLYELIFMTDSPPYAVVDETVEAVKNSRSASSAGFVNWMLREYLRNKALIESDIRKLDMALRESHPDIMVRRWRSFFGPGKTLKLCQWNNQSASVCIRPIVSKISARELLGKFASAGIDAKAHPFRPDEFISLPRGVSVRNIPGYNEGLFTVQDPSTGESVRLLAPLPGESVLDACAAPGGKTSIIADMMHNKGMITAMDVSRFRLNPLYDNVKRLGITCVNIAVGDATNRKSLARLAPRSGYDRILLDVPCTNTGVLRRRPDARWRFNLGELKRICSIQEAMLDAVSPFLKKGGRMVFSNCSMEPEEGTEMIHYWIRKRSDFRTLERVSLLPPASETDGVFAIALEKK